MKITYFHLDPVECKIQCYSAKAAAEIELGLVDFLKKTKDPGQKNKRCPHVLVFEEKELVAMEVVRANTAAKIAPLAIVFHRYINVSDEPSLLLIDQLTKFDVSKKAKIEEADWDGSFEGMSVGFRNVRRHVVTSPSIQVCYLKEPDGDDNRYRIVRHRHTQAMDTITLTSSELIVAEVSPLSAEMQDALNLTEQVLSDVDDAREYAFAAREYAFASQAQAEVAKEEAELCRSMAEEVAVEQMPDELPDSEKQEDEEAVWRSLETAPAPPAGYTLVPNDLYVQIPAELRAKIEAAKAAKAPASVSSARAGGEKKPPHPATQDLLDSPRASGVRQHMLKKIKQIERLNIMQNLVKLKEEEAKLASAVAKEASKREAEVITNLRNFDQGLHPNTNTGTVVEGHGVTEAATVVDECTQPGATVKDVKSGTTYRVMRHVHPRLMVFELGSDHKPSTKVVLWRPRDEMELVKKAPPDPRMLSGTEVTWKNEAGSTVVGSVDKAVGHRLKLLCGDKSFWVPYTEVQLKEQSKSCKAVICG